MMHDQFRRAVLAFPDEDVLVGTRFLDAGGFEAFKALDDIVPRPGHKATGEERAWGRRLAKRFGIENGGYDDRSFIANGDGSFPCVLDHESLKPEAIDARGRGAVRRRRHEAGRLAHRLRLGDGRAPRQAQLTRASRTNVGATVAPIAPTVDPEFALGLGVDFARSCGGGGWCGRSGRTRSPARARSASSTRRRRAPAAGNSDGTDLVVLEGPEQTRRYWDITLPAGSARERFGWPAAARCARARAAARERATRTSSATPSPTRRRPGSASRRTAGRCRTGPSTRRSRRCSSCWRRRRGTGGVVLRHLRPRGRVAARPRRARRDAGDRHHRDRLAGPRGGRGTPGPLGRTGPDARLDEIVHRGHW